MPLSFTLWFIAAGLIGAVWAGRAVFIGMVMRRRSILRPDSCDGPPTPPPRVSIVVAAKDEEANIGACVASLLAQDYPNYEVIAVDDRSRDRTPEILEELRTESDGRLRVLRIQRLRPGWFGKNNAMREGIEASTGEWVLMTDADCRFVSKEALSIATREALREPCDFLCVIPVLDVPTVWEKLVQPIAALVLILWFLPEKVNDPKRRTAYANGAFMMIRRTCYDAVGGHEAVRTEVNEDIWLAHNVKRSGFRLRVIENVGLIHSRMYHSFREAWRGWSRIYYGSLASLGKLAVALLMLAWYSLTPWTSFVVALTGWSLAPPESAANWRMAVMVWALVVLLLQITLFRFYGIVRVGRVWSLGYIFSACAVFTMLVNAVFKTLGTTTTWRGTTYLRDKVYDAGAPVVDNQPQEKPG